MQRGSYAKILTGWALVAACLYALAFTIKPLAGLAVLIIVVTSLLVTIVPVIHFFLARRSMELGIYNPFRTAAFVAGLVLFGVAVLAFLGPFNFA